VLAGSGQLQQARPPADDTPQLAPRKEKGPPAMRGGANKEADKEKKGPAINLQVMLWPVTDANFETASYLELGEGRFLSSNMMKWFWDNYLPDKDARKEIYASPLEASLEQLQGLPPTLIQTAENDVLRDEGEAFARKLDEAGVSVTLTRYGGLIHDYGLLNPLADVPAVKTALLQAAAFIKKSLSD